MKKNRRQLMVAILAGLLALLMILPMVMMVFTNMTAGASSKDIQKELDALKDKNKDLAGEQAELKKQIKAIQSDKNAALNKKDLLEGEIDVIRATIRNLDDQITVYGELIEGKRFQVADAQAKEEAQFERFCKQVRVMEESGTVSYWSILFAADSFTDLLERVSLVNDIAAYNQKVCDELEATQARLKSAQADLEASQQELEEAKAGQQAAQEELAAQEAEVDKLIGEISADEALAKKALDDLAAAADAADKEIAQKEKELEAAIAEERRKAEEQRKAGQTVTANKYQFDPGSGFYWPLPSDQVRVTSFFGPRSDPITGAYSNHTGTDIAAPKNTPIYAAHGGVVLTSVKQGSYGNYVVLSRGDGVTTLYAHMNSRAVNVGDVVSQGQVIGYVGTTGRSTGNHLHLEVRVNGVRQDALRYYPNISWENHTGFSYS